MSSQTKQRRVVVTGIGVVSPIGIGRENFWTALNASQSGIGMVESEDRHVAFHGVGGEIPEFNEKSLKKEYFTEKDQKKSIKVMCREVQMGAAAALMALRDSGIDMDSIDHSRIGVEYGANLMYYPPDSLADACKKCVSEDGEFDYREWGGTGLGAMEPLWMLKYLPNMPACHIGIFTDSQGPNNSVTIDEASAGVAMTEALNILERGAAEVMIVGGTGTRLHPVKTLHARLLDELGYDEANISASCKPFDRNRNGQVVAESAGCLILEEEEHALARGATIYGRFLAGASSCVARPDGTADTRQAVTNSLNSAMRRGQVQPSDLGHVNAHGLGTVRDDQTEAASYREMFGDHEMPVTSLKGYFGNSGAASGFLEVAASLLALNQGVIPQTLNCSEPDDSLGIQVVSGEHQPTQNKLFANVNFTSLGQASAVILEANSSAS
ncbi:beta-ketoacyl-[acyl-carrier-protein] synthase family protein [Thalassoglobus sp. JC818]|uniref:beta-ketoacyl-[acyl-carrier-protein] synthase family protein n=1 Tax=Thalassoglobus sp. JC818 TaxID=3232136 RepID=UPI003458491C